MERDAITLVNSTSKTHFNSHAHVERDFFRFTLTVRIFISTHTLTWSVTAVLVTLDNEVIISTHTLTWSVTNADETKFDEIVISTHTLTWSVTLFPFYPYCQNIHFNSHAHVERDCCTCNS